jgi:eukaryotic-like serine/threonine-protein kinase
VAREPEPSTSPIYRRHFPRLSRQLFGIFGGVQAFAIPVDVLFGVTPARHLLGAGLAQGFMDVPVQEGEILAGKYRVERVLGVGGMGVVVAAHHLALDRRVAIKFLLSEASANPEVLARFAREARAAVKIESEHVARVIDVGALESGAPYMVMEYLVGNDLAHQVAAQGALPIEDAVDFVLQASEAIAEAHAAGIVHRDLKPANLFLTRRADGSKFVKVLDFGISKTLIGVAGSQPDMSLTKTAAVMGSPLYMAPEQMRSTRNVDARADIWALGVILFELLSGKVPFEATTMPELCAMVLTEAPPRLTERRADVPPGLSAIIERCLQKDPALRFSNLSELANALVSFAPSRSRVSAERIALVLRAAGIETDSVAPAGVLADAPSSRVGDSTSAAWSPSTTGATQRVNKLAVGAVLLGVAAAAGVGLLFVLRGHASETTQTPPSSATPSNAAAPTPPAVPVSIAPLVTPEGPADSQPLPLASAAAVTSSASRPAVPAAPVGVRRSTKPAVKNDKPAPPEAPPAPVAAPPPAPAPVPVPVPRKNPLNVGLK